MNATIPKGVRAFDAAEYLGDEETIAEYLNACAEYGDPALLLSALANVARARGMTAVAKDAGLGRESLYKALAPGAQPRYETIFRVAEAIGAPMRFAAAKRPDSAGADARPRRRAVPGNKKAAAASVGDAPARKARPASTAGRRTR